MKILLLADPNSAHTQRWAKSLSQKGLEIHIFGLSQTKENSYTDSPQIKIYSGDIDPSVSKQDNRIFAKLGYLSVLSKLKRIIKEIEPDIVHAHYATSYGLLGALSGFHPLIISIWGSDVFDFPNRSWLHRSLLKFNLNNADKILSTSHIMATETAKYTDKAIEVTPFGIDLNIFKKGAAINNLFNNTDIVIGTIKNLEKVYGIEYLLQAFKILKNKYPQLPLKLLIVGSGSQEKSLKNLAKILDIEKDTAFTGFVPYEKLSQYHNAISVFVALSNQESFGVAVLEAAACSKPAVVSDVGGLPEIVDDNITGIIVPPANPQKAAEAIEKLIMNKELYDKMGAAARKKVENSYNWDDNVEQMTQIYKKMKNRMNIILINHYAGSRYHGMEYRPYYIAKEWIKSGHNVTIIASSESHVRTKKPVITGEIAEENIDGINYIWLKTPPYKGNNIGRVKNMFAFIFQIKKYENYILSKHNPNVVIASSTYPFDIYPAAKLAKRSKAKLIFEVHDLWPLSPIELGGYSPYHPFMMMLQWAENYAYKHADKVISMLPKAKEHMVSHGMAPEKFVYVPNGINIDEWESEKGSIPDEHLKIITELKQKGNFLIGYAGAHGRANALHSLVSAAALIKDKPVSIILVGHGPEKEALQQQANKVELENIKFLPSINKSTIPHFLSLMDAVYIGLQKQSLFRFGVSPNKLMDYMMAAKPVIHAIEAGNDMVAESGCGISIPPEDPKVLSEAMLKMSSLSSEERSVMGAKGKEYVLHNNDYRVLAKRFEEIMIK